MTEHVFTIDLGTSGPKVALFTMAGELVAGEFEAVEVVLSPGGGAEQRPAEWWSGVVAASQRLHDAAAVPAESIAAVSVTSQWSGTVPVDETGEPLHDALIWMDSRGAEQIARVVGGPVRVAGYDPRKLRTWVRLTGGAPAHSGKDPIAHILWLEEHRPAVAAATWKYLEPKDWLNLRLTGRCVATHDSIVVHWLTDNRDPDRVDYHADLLELAGIPRRVLPDLVPATSVVGPLSAAAAAELGLPAGIPVVGGTPDVQSAAIGSGAVRDFEGHLYVGTSSWISCHVPWKRTDVLHGVASLPAPLPGRYFVADEQESAGACLGWLADRVLFPPGTPRPAEVFGHLDAVAAAAPPGAHGVVFAPWLNGERTPVDDHDLRGGWHGVGLGADQPDLVRAVLEGVAANTRWLLECVEHFTRRRFPWLNFVGGGAQSSLWSQIMADVLQRPIRRVEHPIRANARGAALLAALALGRTDVEGIARGVRITATHVPDPATKPVYDHLYGELRAIHKATRGIYRRRPA